MDNYLEKTIVLPAFFNDSVQQAEVLIKALEQLQSYDISTIEFRYAGQEKDKVKEALQKYGLKSIYLGAAATKPAGLGISLLDEELRQQTISIFKQCIDEAYFYGSRAILINSGPAPEETDKEQEAYILMKEALEELLDYTIEKAEDYLLDITLETGDRGIEFNDLIGPTELAVRLAREINDQYANFYLTLDTSHLRQLNENTMESINQAFKYCYHLHLANCVLIDQESPLYGDKHPEFNVANGEFNNQEIREIYQQILKLYQDQRLYIGFEIINKGHDSQEYLQNITEELNWFFEK